MRILSHYFAARFLGLFATVFAAAFLVLATVELVLNFDDLSRFGSASAMSLNSGGVLAIGRSLGIRLASYYMADVIPIVSFLAVFITIAWAGRAMELIGVQAGGIRLIRITAPILAASLILSFATAILHETVILRSQQISAGHEDQKHRQPDFGREAFWYHRGHTVTKITMADASTRTLQGVAIFERGAQGTITRVIRASIVVIELDGSWQLRDASIWTFDPTDPRTDPEFEKRASLTLDLDAMGGDALLHADPEVLPIAALARYLDANPDITPSSLRRLRARFHERLAAPWLVVFFAWLALPFALRVDERGHFGPPAAAGLAALSAFFLFRSAGSSLAQQEWIPVGLTPWLAISLVCLGATVALWRQRS